MPTNVTRDYQKEVVKTAAVFARLDTCASNYSNLTTNIILSVTTTLGKYGPIVFVDVCFLMTVCCSAIYYMAMAP
jgi:hypothetical protein